MNLSANQFASSAGARAIAAADFDRNGWIDLAHANFGSNTVTILLNTGSNDPDFVKSQDVAVGAGPFDLAAADFNRDGRIDLAVANADAHSISILIGQSSGAFSRTDIAAPRGPRGIIAADVNKDARTDLVVSGWESGSVQILLGNGAGGFSAGATSAAAGARPQGMDIADFNRDGHLDVVAADESVAGLRVLMGNGTALMSRVVAGEQYLNVVVAGDFNRDGWIDAAAASSAASKVAVYLGTASGLRFARSYMVGASPRGIAAEDVNHDGLLDLITANRTSGTVSVLLGSASAPGTFADAFDVAAGPRSRALVAADFDHDGRLDLATGNQEASSVTVLWNETPFERAAYSFSRMTLGTGTSVWSSANNVWPADFNEDGALDVVTLTAWENTASGRQLDVLITGGAVVGLSLPARPDGFWVADANRDGHADVIAFMGFPSSAVWVLLGDGRGGFQLAPQATSSLRRPRGAIGDLNGDGIVDLAFAAYAWNGTTTLYFLETLWGNGDGSFRPGARIQLPTWLGELRIADVNRDGKADVVGIFDRSLTVWFGDGAGGLRAGWRTAWSSSDVDALGFGDVNHDGFIDAVSSYERTVSLALGHASGFMAPTVVHEGSLHGPDVTIADVTLDGNPDLVTDQGAILQGNGDGTFQPADRFSYMGVHVRVADFTRDGLPDLILATYNGSVDIIVNTRGMLNHPPSIDLGPDRTFDYADQFGEEEPEIWAWGTDPDLHSLSFEWRGDDGTVRPGQSLVLFHELPGTHRFTVTVRDGRGGSATDSITITIRPMKEVVLWAADGWGDWPHVADTTAAGGVRAHDPNAGAPKVIAPAPNPSRRFTMAFVADPTQTYKLWVRLKAEGNSWRNDSVWVQFSGAADAAGNPIYRTGTASGLAVNLEECSGCGVAGWGWEDDGWGAANQNGVTLRFPAGGYQTLILQTREDGVSVDQIVLSAERHLNTRPGAAKNDGTILAPTYRPY